MLVAELKEWLFYFLSFLVSFLLIKPSFILYCFKLKVPPNFTKFTHRNSIHVARELKSLVGNLDLFRLVVLLLLHSLQLILVTFLFASKIRNVPIKNGALFL